MEIPHSYIIHDTRIAKDFQGITICGYKRKDVIDAFQNSIINNDLLVLKASADSDSCSREPSEDLTNRFKYKV